MWLEPCLVTLLQALLSSTNDVQSYQLNTETFVLPTKDSNFFYYYYYGTVVIGQHPFGWWRQQGFLGITCCLGYVPLPPFYPGCVPPCCLFPLALFVHTFVQGRAFYVPHHHCNIKKKKGSWYFSSILKLIACPIGQFLLYIQ